MDAKKAPVGPDDLGPWFRGRKQVVVAKGKKYATHTLRSVPVAERPALVLGPSGKLRAPSLIVGDVLLVGFNEEMYAEHGL